jgi:hypothetical protein
MMSASLYGGSAWATTGVQLRAPEGARSATDKSGSCNAMWALSHLQANMRS